MILPLSANFLLVFRTVPTVWYIYGFHYTLKISYCFCQLFEYIIKATFTLKPLVDLKTQSNKFRKIILIGVGH